ncbi:MAG: T9SS type A sorting domain-containing protein [Bacteroidetes bacterium]|nr:T9SS type A sorting domain-containing protein [Bacteroidota bacterium]
MSTSGQLIKQEKHINGTTVKVNVSDIPKGVYFVEINNSGAITRTKFIKE